MASFSRTDSRPKHIPDKHTFDLALIVTDSQPDDLSTDVQPKHKPHGDALGFTDHCKPDKLAIIEPINVADHQPIDQSVRQPVGVAVGIAKPVALNVADPQPNVIETNCSANRFTLDRPDSQSKSKPVEFTDKIAD